MGPTVRAGQIWDRDNSLGQAYGADRTGRWQPMPVAAYRNVGELCPAGEANVTDLLPNRSAGWDDEDLSGLNPLAPWGKQLHCFHFAAGGRHCERKCDNLTS